MVHTRSALNSMHGRHILTIQITNPKDIKRNHSTTEEVDHDETVEEKIAI